MDVRLRMVGERALFARPELRHDVVSYDLITPHAARGILDAIHRSPGMRWAIDAIRVMRPIRRECIEEGGRRILMLRDVGYVIDAHVEMDPGSAADAAERHVANFERAARSRPSVYLGRVGFDAAVATIDTAEPFPAPARSPTVVDHGWLLHSDNVNGDRRPRFFRAEAIDGLVRVPTADSPLLFG